MAYLEDLNNIATTLLQEYTNKNLVPEWFSINMKTLLSKNITLEDWNNVQWYLKNVAAENEAVFKYCKNLNSVLTNVDYTVAGLYSEITGIHMKLEHEYPRLENQKIPSKYLPSYADDVLEVPGIHNQTTGEFNKIYVDINTNKIYRWNGAQNGMVELGGVSQKEIWKFTLEDGTVVEKEVHVS